MPCIIETVEGSIEVTEDAETVREMLSAPSFTAHRADTGVEILFESHNVTGIAEVDR